eukprot:1849-Heterococcus_DN1.PRE.4
MQHSRRIYDDASTSLVAYANNSDCSSYAFRVAESTWDCEGGGSGDTTLLLLLAAAVTMAVITRQIQIVQQRFVDI